VYKNYGEITKTKPWKDWREAVFERDGFTCQICRKKGGYLNPHHIIPKSHDFSKVFNKRNGITLCYDCHTSIRELHKKYSPLQTLLRKIVLQNEAKVRKRRKDLEERRIKKYGNPNVRVQQRKGKRPPEPQLF